MADRSAPSLESRMKPVGRPRLVAVVQEDCTGCNTCVDFCLVDCIESAPPASPPQSLSSISIREDECIGCFVCAKVCEELSVNAIRLQPADSPLSGLARAANRQAIPSREDHRPIPR
jgi:NAD-dependent dihydropyrimidine dehydrogenase PreA subunit